MSDDASLLLALRLKAFATSEVIAALADLEVEPVQAAMSNLERRGLVIHRRGRIHGWSLTATGRRHGESLLRAELGPDSQRRIEVAYEQFLGLNGELLSICTDWQTTTVGEQRVPNDHADPDRDRWVLQRFDRLHASSLPVTRALAEALWRFEPYAGRLERAHARVAAGEHDWLARPTLDSYHGVWFELHEHLLATLGRDRATEVTPTDTTIQNGDRT